MAPEQRDLIWQSVVIEIASMWASVERPGKSAGRVFIGPKGRFLFWPKDLNALLLHAPSSVGRLLDLFSIAAMVGVKLDIASAYRALELDPNDAVYHAALIDGMWVVFHRLSFGMAQSPAIFATALATTLDRYHGAFPATLAALTQWVDDSGLSGVSTATALMAAEELMIALKRDRWWQAVAKTWLHPAVRLLYTGFLVDFPGRTIRIARDKLDKLIRLLDSVQRPTDSAVNASVPSPDSADASNLPSQSRRSRLAALVASPAAMHHVAMGPITDTDNPSPCRRVHLLRGTGDPDLPSSFGTRNTTTYGSAAEACSALPGCIATACLDDAALIITAPDASLAQRLRATVPSTPTTTVIVVTPAHPVDPSADPAALLQWWNPTHRLPDRFRSDRVNPDALPSAADVSLPSQSGARLTLRPEEFAALRSAVGLMSWFCVALPFLAVWRAALNHLVTSATWSPFTAAAFDAVAASTRVLCDWEFSVDPPRRTLFVRTDASGTGWGAVITLPCGRVVRLAGALDPATAIAASGVREAAAAVAAVRAAIAHPDIPPFDAVHVTVDSTNLCGAADGHPRAEGMVAAVAPLAAWAAQGLRVKFEWSTRSAIEHAAPDALSSAASRATPWPLAVDVHAALRASCPWNVVAWAYRGQDTPGVGPSDAYATPTASDLPAERAAVLQGLQTLPPPHNGSATGRTGWVGMSESLELLDDEVAYAHPLWSDIAAVLAWQQRGDKPLVLVAPRPSPANRGKFWESYVDSLTGRCIAYADLPDPATVPPVPGTTRDPIPLRAYVLGGRAPDPVANQRGSSLGTPARLAWVRGGRNPGDGPGLLDALVTPKKGEQQRDTHPAPAPAAPPSRAPGPRPTTARVPTNASTDRRLASTLCTPPAAAPSAATSRVRPRSDATAPVGEPTAKKRAIPPPPARQSPPTTAAGSTRVGPSATAAALAKPGTLHSLPATVRAWFVLLRDFVAGMSSGTVDDDIPEALRGDLAAARGVIRLKAIAGSRRPTCALRQVYTVASLLPGVLDSPFNAAVLDALAVAFARRRLIRPPPFGWQPANAATAQSALSSVAALSRKAGVPAAKVCGVTAAAFLDARGANGRREHSEAWPVHLHDLLEAEPCGPHPPSGPTNQWWTWAALVTMSFLCLRTGILHHLMREMLVAYDGGFIFCWRWISKTTSADILDPELKSAVIRVSAARHPALTRIMTAAPRSGRIFPAAAVSADALTNFVRQAVGDVPDNFVVRSYGVRIAADCEAVELGVPGDVIDALFWWRRLVAATRAYYSGIMLRLMFLFSEHRCRLRFAHVAPGSYDARIVGGPPPSFSRVAVLQGDDKKFPVLPKQAVADLNAAWGCEPTTVPDSRMQIARANAAAAATLVPATDAAAADPDPVFPPPAKGAGAAAGEPDSGADSFDESGDCDGCDAHMDRFTRGTMCEDPTCPKMRCRTCHPVRRVWRCSAHPSRRGKKGQ